MIRRLRYVLTIVRDLSMILCPASASVRAGVRDAELLADFEAEHDVMPPIRLGPVVDSMPSLGHPVEGLVEFHHVERITGDGVYCACGHRSKSFHQHAKHVAGFVLSMVEADARIAAATNKFQN